eukprot:scaffold3900_cov92-Phaeocystis_antarctica.AAC.2
MKKTFATEGSTLVYQCRLESLRLTRSVLPGRHSQKCIEAKRRYTSRLATQYGPTERTREAESSYV